MTSTDLVPTTLRPVAVAFVVFGFFAGGWAVATVDIERTFHLTDAGLGALLAAGIIAATAVAAIGGADHRSLRRAAARSTLALVVVGRAARAGGVARRISCCSFPRSCWRWPRAVSSTS